MLPLHVFLGFRCLSYASVQQIHLFDPAGHLKGCQDLLQNSISELAAQEGRSVVLRVRDSQSNVNHADSRSSASGGQAALVQDM